MARPELSDEEVFQAARRIPPGEARGAYLDRVCGEDAELRTHLEALLRAFDDSPSYLESPAPGITAGCPPAIDQPTERPGSQIGPYKLLEQIGEGGMGVVYLAEQEQPVKRRVALKIIKPGMDSAQVIARFEAERQALALMDHPNIAKVLDAGATPCGRPFFVMELVKGVPITEYCDERQLTPRRRLELLIPVCQAVQHAHQKGIIHRDIKPTNILVAEYDEQSVPKVIDFGVAKAISSPLTEKTVFTQVGQLVGTLEYMSPEQAQFNQLDIDTRSDIYSLGVLLYELLTGTTPVEQARVRTLPFDETLRIIREEEPPKPSTKLGSSDSLPEIAANRSVDPARLRKLVRGELDWIVMKCLEKDRNRRYESASSLALDMQRYLADDPVQACPPSAAYRLRKFGKRYRRLLVAATVVVSAILAAAGIIGLEMRDRARRESERDRERVARQAELGRERDLALDQAAALLEVGSWSEVRIATLRIQRLLQQESSDQQRQRFRQIVKDLDTAERLEELGARLILDGQPGPTKAVATDNAYYLAFRDYGIDLTSADARTASQCIRDSAISEMLLSGVDDWAWFRARINSGNNLSNAARVIVPSVELTRLVSLKGKLPDIADLVDNNSERKRIRRLATTPAFSLSSGVKIDRKAAEVFAEKPEAFELSPKSAIFLARALGESDRAIRILASTQQRYPRDLSLNLELAVRLEHARPPQRERAIGFLRAAIVLRPERAELHARLGGMLRQAGSIDESIVAVREAIRLDADNAATRYDLGNLYRDAQSWDEAFRSIDKAIELKPNHGTYFLGRGYVHARLGRWKPAARDYGWVRETNLNNAELWLQYAGVFVLGGDQESYRSFSSRVVEIFNPNSPAAPKFRGGPATEARKSYLAARTLGLAPSAPADPAEIVRLAEAAVAFDPKSGHYLHTLGVARYRCGQFEDAIKTIQASMDADPAWEAMVCNWLVLALAYHRIGKIEQGKEWLNKAVAWMEDGIAKLSGGIAHPLPTLHEHDSIACYVLRREAEELYRDKK